MKTYISDIIPRIQKFSQKLDNLTLLTNQHWVVIDDIDNTKNVYIFRENNELLISQNGKVEKAKWEYLGHNSLLIDRKDDSYLFKHGFFDENILALKIDSKNEYAFLVNETKFDKELNCSINVIEFLNRKYIEPTIKQSIEKQTGFSIESNSESKRLEIYIAPNHIMKKIGEKNPVFGTRSVQYLIEFEDGKKGDIFQRKNVKETYFKAKIGEMWVNSHICYENIDFCIVALHKYLKTGKIYKQGFAGAYE